jgi:glycosyltransferase involved in cell wall biosynthesis
MEKKKLALFNFVVHFGGAQRSNIFLCEQLRKHDEVTVIDAYGNCRQYIDALAARDIATHILMPDAPHIFVGYPGKLCKRAWRALRQIPAFLKLQNRLSKTLREIDPHVIWTTETKALLFLATNWRLRKYPVVMFARGWYRRHQVPGWKRWLIRHRADCVLAVSNATAEALASWGVRREDIQVVFNTIDYDSVVRASKKEPSGKLSGQKKSLKILVPGQLLRTKGQHTAIQAASLLNQKGVDFVMWIAGSASVADKSKYHEYLKELVLANGLEERVFLLEWCPDIPALMRLADVVVLPTHTEGLPRVILEAMILKRPIISTPAGGVVDLIADGKTGLLGPVDDERALAENIEKLIHDRSLVDCITQKAYEQVIESFSVKNHVKAVRYAFEDVLEKRKQ